MNKERYNQIIDEVYKNYLEKYKQDKTYGIVYYTDPLQYRPYTKVEFINKIKTNIKFSENWGLKIEERELDMFERWKIADLTPNMMEIDYCNKLCDEHNVPTKLITVTHNNETVEIYE
jgi:hypothetical protein